MSNGSKTKRSPLFIIFMTVFIDLLGFGIVLPLSPYYAEHFGATAIEVGLLQAVYSLAQFIFAPLWGRLSDRVGRRPIILMSIAGGCISFFVFANADKLWILFASRAFQGVFGANLSAAQAYIADVTTKENRSKGMGVIGAAFGLGFVFGPFIGSQLIQYGPSVGAAFGREGEGIFGMGFPALIASLMCLGNFLFAAFKLPESLTQERRAHLGPREGRYSLFLKAMKNSRVAWLIIAFFMATFAMGNMESTLPLYTERRMNYGVIETGKLFALVGIMIAFTQGYLIRKLLPKIGERKMILIGPILSALGLSMIALTHNGWQICGALMILAVGSGIFNPAILGGISLVTDPTEQGGVLGVNQSLSSLARFLGPACGGFLFQQMNIGTPFLFAGFVMACALILGLKNVSKLPDAHKTGGATHG